MRINRKDKIIILCFLLLFSFQVFSCSAQQEAVNILVSNQQKFQKGIMTPLQQITPDVARIAKDDKNGTLYYGGLLLYFNEAQDRAELLLRRSSRTSQEPWARESTRLIVYFMIRGARYNQVKPYLQELLSIDEIRNDVELFYYYAFSLFLTKDYEELENLILLEDDVPKPQWVTTLRNRVQIKQAMFSYDLWKALMRIRKDAKEDVELYNTLVAYPTDAMIDSVPIFVNRIYKEIDKKVPTNIASVLNVKFALQTKNTNVSKKILDLPAQTFVHSGMIEDVLRIAQKNRSYRNKVQVLLKQAEKYTTQNVQKSHVSVGQAELYYNRGYYKRSLALYSRAFIDKEVYTLLPQNVQNKALWRLLSSTIQIDPRMFIKNFDEVIAHTNNAKYFSNVLEEYLSILLQQKKYVELEKSFRHLASKYTNHYIRAELNRWYFILKRIYPNFQIDNLELDFFDSQGVFHRQSSYKSDSPFEYLLYTNKVSKSEFLGSWTTPEESATSMHIVDETKRVVISEALLEGYFLYGLYDYAHGIVFNKSYQIGIDIVRNVVEYLIKKKAYAEVVTLLKKFASESILFPQNEKDFLHLYPYEPFRKNVQAITKDSKERAVLYALMREESDFRPTVYSPAGAIGLMQLLPATAQEMAERISYGSFSLKNPTDNITLGYTYYKYLLKVVKKPVYAFAAYNGGIGNLWKWEKNFDTSDPIVFADSLPFRETRNYVRKIVSSALIYGMLYYNIPTEEMIAYLFNTK